MRSAGRSRRSPRAKPVSRPSRAAMRRFPRMEAKHHVLIVGGAGYIGSVLTPTLLSAGHRVRVLDSLLYDNSDTLAAVADHERFEFVQGDVRSTDDVSEAVDGITDVVLLAALVGDPVCKRNPGL